MPEKKRVFDPQQIEPKWQEKWEKERLYQPNLDTAKKPYFNLMMFPYPSAEGLHVGNMYAFTGSDIHGRFKRMQGFDVFEPMGLDGFGIHSENYALKVGTNPMNQSKKSEANFYRQLRSIGNGYDWTHTVETYKPDYYQWTQWIFTRLFRAGLAYKAKAPVNFCPSCKTVLADEQVIDARPSAASATGSKANRASAGEVGRGACERCGSVVERRDLEQWFFEITKYADRLLDDLKEINWTEKVKIAQENWIGRKEGVEIVWEVAGKDGNETGHKILTFTTRKDTIPGVTFLVLAPESEYVSVVTTPDNQEKVSKYIEISKKKSTEEAEKEKTGVFTGSFAKNPFSGAIVPIYVADYVLGGYGTGAVMGMPGHDERDREFAKVFDLPTILTTEVPKDFQEAVYAGAGKQINTGNGYDGLSNKEAGQKIFAELKAKGFAHTSIQYHLRDWLISRQRYWGPPIPMIFCGTCAKAGKGEIKATSWDAAGWYSVSDDALPVVLPYIDDFKPLGTGKAPLANHEEFYKTTCPGCSSEAVRETDVSDTFLDSAWYFFRYIATENTKAPWTPSRAKKWLPVTMYIGGAEHSVLHLLYARFITKVFYDLKLIYDFQEPFTTFYAHGLIIKDGAKMSKSKGNVVVPDEYIRKFGADTLRTYLMFLGPFNHGGDFRDTGIEGIHRFLKRVWVMLTAKQIGEADDTSVKSFVHFTIKGITEDMEQMRYNTAIAKVMELYNFLNKKETVSRFAAETMVKLLAPFAPHMTEELWEKMGHSDSIHTTAWPSFDPEAITAGGKTIVIQVNGKLRGELRFSENEEVTKEIVEKKALGEKSIQKYVSGRETKKVIYVPNRLINFVI